MIDSLLEVGIKKETIDRLEENEYIAYNLSCSLDECKNIIEYLRSIHINNVDDILVYKPEMFLDTKSEIEELFSKKDTQQIVELVNNDFTNIDIIFE